MTIFVRLLKNRVVEYQIEIHLYGKQEKDITKRYHCRFYPRHCGLDPQSPKERRNIA